MMWRLRKSLAASLFLAFFSLALFLACEGEVQEEMSSGAVEKTLKDPAEALPEETMEVTLVFEKMTCEHCVNTIRKALAGCSGVSSVDVDLESKTALVKGNQLDTHALSKAVAAKGYPVVSITSEGSEGPH